MKGTYLNMKKILTINLIVLIIIHILSNVSCAINSDSRWNIYFENIEIKDGSVEATQAPTLTNSSNLEITYSVNLNLPGEFYEFTVDVVNNGNIDAMVNNVSINELSAEQKKYVSYNVTYSDGTTETVNGFAVPVEALGEDFDLAILGEKGTWYDHVVSVTL